MAELSKIKFNGAEYDLKDAIARNNITNINNKINNYHVFNLYKGAVHYEDDIVGMHYPFTEFNDGIEKQFFYWINDNSSNKIRVYPTSKINDIGKLTLIGWQENTQYNIIFHEITDAGDDLEYEVTTQPIIRSIPTNISAFTNDSGFITSNDIPEDKIFPINVTLTSMTEGTSDKTHTEILAAVNAGKIPFVYIDYSGSKMIASLLFANSNRVSFVYDNQVTEGFGDYAFLQIQNSNVTITWKEKYITQDDLPTLATVATSGSYNDLSNTPTIPTTTSELTNDSDFITSSDLPDTSTFMVKGTDYVTAGQQEGTTLGTYSTAEGAHVIASGNASHAEGSATTASGQYSHAEGMGQCYTLGKISGDANATTYTATSVENIVIGQDLVYNGKTAKVTSLDRNSKTFTVNNTLSEEAVSEVYFAIDNKSSGKAAHSEGEGCTSSNLSAHAEGGYTVASGVWTHTEGYGTRATSGQSHAEGQFTQALAVDAHSEGYSTTASGVGAHAEGGKTVASGKYAHAENYSTIASGNYSHAENYSATASGNYSHAEGYNTNASGSLSHAGGHTTTASGLISHAEGWNTIASRESQFVFGELNIEDTEGTTNSRGKYVEIVGNGTEGENNVVTRSNARTLDWDGNEVLAGKLTVGTGPTANMDVATKQYVDTAIGNVNSFNVSVVSTLPATGDTHTIYFVPQASPSTAHDEYMYINNSWELIGSTQIDLSNYVQSTDLATVATSGNYNDLSNKPTIPAAQVQSDWNATTGMGVILNKPDLSIYMVKGTDYVTAGQKAETTLGDQATAEGFDTTASGVYSHAEGNETNASGDISHAEGDNTTASGYSSHTEGWGTIASGDYSHAEGFSTTANGESSHAEGGATTASGEYSHAEGCQTTASGARSHAEGDNTTASGRDSHAEGSNTTASASYSHAEGGATTASGQYSHVEGYYTIAQRKSQHVFGEYNIADTTGASGAYKGTYIEIVGNGTSSTRSNARTLDWSGNEILAGKLTVGAAPTNNMDVATKQYVDNSIPTVPTNISAFTNDAGYLTTTSTPKTIYVPIEYDETNEKYFTTSEETYNSLRDKINNGWNIVLVYYNNYYYLSSDYNELGFKQSFGETLNDFYITWNEQNEILYEETQGTGGTSEPWGVYTGNHTLVTEPNTHTFYKDNSNTYIYDGTNFQQISLYEFDDIKYHTITRQENTGEYLIDGQEYHSINNILGSKITILAFSDKIFYYSGDYIFKTLPFIENGTGKMMYYQLELKQGTGINRLSYHLTNYEPKYQLAPTITNTLSSGTLIATINGTNIYAPSYIDADEVSY